MIRRQSAPFAPPSEAPSNGRRLDAHLDRLILAVEGDDVMAQARALDELTDLLGPGEPAPVGDAHRVLQQIIHLAAGTHHAQDRSEVTVTGKTATKAEADKGKGTAAKTAEAPKGDAMKSTTATTKTADKPKVDEKKVEKK